MRNAGCRTPAEASPEECPRTAPRIQPSFHQAACAGSTTTRSWSARAITGSWPRCAQRARGCVCGGRTREPPASSGTRTPPSTARSVVLTVASARLFSCNGCRTRSRDRRPVFGQRGHAPCWLGDRLRGLSRRSRNACAIWAGTRRGRARRGKRARPLPKSVRDQHRIDDVDYAVFGQNVGGGDLRIVDLYSAGQADG